MKKGFLTLAAIAAIFSATNAATPKTDAKDASASTTKSESKSKLANTYYVTGLDGNGNYTLSTDPNDAPNCGLGSIRPCEITSDSDLGQTVPMEDVDSENGIHIESKQRQFQ